MTKHQNIDSAPQANHCNCHHVKMRMNEVILFDLLVAGSHQTLAAVYLVTQGMDLMRFDEEAPMGNNANESTQE